MPIGTNGNGTVVRKKKVKTFAEVVTILREKGAPEGFRRCRDILFSRAEELAAVMPLYNVLKLAIEVDRHALFCEVAADKAHTQHDAEAYAAYQAYLSGQSDQPVAVGLPLGTAPAPATAPDADTEDDEEEGEDGIGNRQERP